MSQITRCPQCQTRFKVVDDQLRISDGWVRCGKCKSVFDALTHLVQKSEPATSSPDVAVAPVATSTPVVQAPSFIAPAPALPERVELPVSAVNAEPVAAVVVKSVEVAESVVTPGAAAVVSVPQPLTPAESSAVMVTGNSVAVDPHANVPELSVLVFPRRGFGESGYVDSSWMSAYDDKGYASASAYVAQLSSTEAAKPLTDPALESEWSDAIDHRPQSLRDSSVDFSAQDDLAELQARENRLLEAIEKRQARKRTKQVSLPDAEPIDEPVVDVLTPAPSPPADERDVFFPAVPPVSGRSQALPTVPAASVPAESSGGAAAKPAAPADEVLLVAPEMAGRVVEQGKIEPALNSPPNYIEEMDSTAGTEVQAVQEPGFVKDAKRKAFWNQPWVMLVSFLCALALLLGLVFQVMVAQRDRLVVEYPQVRPLLEKMCEVAKCQIALPRHLQSVVIDSTTFNEIGPRQFRLTVVFRNTADYAVAVPALELSLNDAAEKLQLRRILMPVDMQAPAALEARGNWTAVVAIKVAENGQDVVGYKVLAFYP